MNDLKAIPLFRFLDQEQQDVLCSYGKKIRFKKGDILIKEETFNDTLFILLRGRLRVTRKVGKNTLVLAELDAPNTLGELTFLEPGTSSATCLALTEGNAITLPHDTLNKLINDHPDLSAYFLQGLALNLKDRLLKTNEQVASYFDISKALMDSQRFREFYGQLFR